MASLADIFTTAKNVVTAINGLAQTYLSVEGNQSSVDLGAPTVVMTGQGRIARVSVTIAGTTPGVILDAASSAATTGSVFTIPNTAGIYEVNMPVSNGITVLPGTGQLVAISYS